MYDMYVRNEPLISSPDNLATWPWHEAEPKNKLIFNLSEATAIPYLYKMIICDNLLYIYVGFEGVCECTILKISIDSSCSNIIMYP